MGCMTFRSPCTFWSLIVLYVRGSFCTTVLVKVGGEIKLLPKYNSHLRKILK
jgi:hypothetical protein